MTVMFPKFFGVPQQVVRKSTLAAMKPSEVYLYIYLQERSEWYCSRVIRATDAEISAKVRVAPRSLRNARVKLQERGLIQYKKGAGNKYVYTICDPETGQPYPGDPRKPIRYKKRSQEPDGDVGPVSETSPSRDTRRPEDDCSPQTHGLPIQFD